MTLDLAHGAGPDTASIGPAGLLAVLPGSSLASGRLAGMSAVEVSEAGGDWSFSFADGLVTELRVGYRFVLVMSEALIGIEQPFTLEIGGIASAVPASDKVWDVSAALPLFNRRVTSARASGTGELQIEFDGGAAIRVEPEPSSLYESWQIELPVDRLWVGIGRTVGQPRTERSE